ncbi:hypothetical protein NL676_039582 [Syzygium grande]|nr:hypothetical protein NL676_039582 [Syzygium grande]
MLQEIISPFETDQCDVLKSICEHHLEDEDGGLNTTFYPPIPADLYSRSSSFSNLLLMESWSELALKVDNSEDTLLYDALSEALNSGWTMPSASNQELDFEVTTIDYDSSGWGTAEKLETVEPELSQRTSLAQSRCVNFQKHFAAEFGIS